MQNGILAWDEFKKDYEYDGSKELRMGQFKMMIQQPFNCSIPCGLSVYFDMFQSLVAQLEAIAPQEYYDLKKKRSLLTNNKNFQRVSLLVQKCRDDDSIT